MAELKETAKNPEPRRRAPEESETDWRDPWAATENDRREFPQTTDPTYTRTQFFGDLEQVSRRITNEISSDPQEVERLRRSINQAKQGETINWRDADRDDT